MQRAPGHGTKDSGVGLHRTIDRPNVPERIVGACNHGSLMSINPVHKLATHAQITICYVLTLRRIEVFLWHVQINRVVKRVDSVVVTRNFHLGEVACVPHFRAFHLLLGVCHPSIADPALRVIRIGGECICGRRIRRTVHVELVSRSVAGPCIFVAIRVEIANRRAVFRPRVEGGELKSGKYFARRRIAVDFTVKVLGLPFLVRIVTSGCQRQQSGSGRKDLLPGIQRRLEAASTCSLQPRG